MVVRFNQDGKGEKYKMAFYKDFVELPLRVFVSIPEFNECHFPKDFERMLRTMAASDPDYVVRLSATRIEIGYKSDEWHELK